MAKKNTKKKSDVKKKNSGKKEKEIFEVENKKTGKEREVVKKVGSREEHADKKELKKQEKQLKVFLWILGFVILAIFVVYFGLKMIRVNYYEDVKFETIQEGDLIFYNTMIPLYDKSGDKIADYNFYLRTNPNKLEKIPFEGDMILLKGYTMNITEEFNCNGDGSITYANLMGQNEVIGIAYIKDDKAGCSSESKYNYFEIKSGNETKIVQRQNEFGEGISCYDVYVNNCEIIPATEKIMAENFVLAQKLKIIY